MPAFERLPNGTSEPSSTIGSIASDSVDREQNFISPDWRTEYITPIQAGIIDHPKLATFIGLNLVLNGIPIILYVGFILSIGSIALLFALAGCVAFTFTCACFALTVLIPTIFLTTTAACTIFFWGLIGYYLLGFIGGTGDVDIQRNEPYLQVHTTSNMQTPSKDPILGINGITTDENLRGDVKAISAKSAAT